MQSQKVALVTGSSSGIFQMRKVLHSNYKLVPAISLMRFGWCTFMTEPILYSKSNDTTFVIYDNKTGNIVHIHRITTLPGASAPSAAEAKTNTLEFVHKIKGKPNLEGN